MMYGLFTSSTAMEAFQTSLDTTADNLANIDTTAFKSSGVDFEDLFYVGPPNLQIGQGVRIAATLRDFSQGPLQQTDQVLDVAIDGNGFFSVMLPDGTINYTRDGSFQKDGLGRLVTAQGNIVQPTITFPSDTLSTTISASGVVTVTTQSSPSQPKVLGQISLVNFENPDGLQALGGNLYAVTPNSGSPVFGTAGTNGLGTIEQGVLEQSNVNITTEFANLASEQQAFIANSRALNTSDQIISSALNIVH